MIELIGYHGTTKTNAEKILKNNKFNESTSKNDWLGHGIYFFKDIEDAKKWSIEKAHRYKDESIVLSANIKCTEEKYIDLDFKSNLNLLLSFAKEILKTSGKDIYFKNKNEEKMCLICDLYKDFYDMNIMTFTFSKKTSLEIKNTIGFKTLPERQICVSNHQCLSNIRIVMRGEDYVNEK